MKKNETITVGEALGVVNKYALETKAEAESFLKVHQTFKDEALDEKIKSHEEQLESLKAMPDVPSIEKLKKEMIENTTSFLEKLYRVKSLLES